MPAPIKPSMFGWLLLPLFMAWLTVNYFVGLVREPTWVNTPNTDLIPVNASVLGLSTAPPTPAQPPPLVWKQTGLVTLWFDDAWSTQFTAGYPLVRAAGYTAALAVPTRLVGFDAYMTWPQVDRLAHAGWEITAHSRRHNCDPNSLPPELLRDEIIGSRQDLLEHGYQANFFVAPCGVLNDSLRQVVKTDYLGLRDSEPALNPLPLKDTYNLHAITIDPRTTVAEIQTWLTQAKAESDWLILMFHQIEDGGDIYSNPPDLVQGIINAVTASGLPVVLPAQVMDMIYAP